MTTEDKILNIITILAITACILMMVIGVWQVWHANHQPPQVYGYDVPVSNEEYSPWVDADWVRPRGDVVIQDLIVVQ